jgi:hypothetical protein
MLDTLPAGLDDAGTMKHRSHRSVAGVAAGAFVLWAVVIAMVAGAKFGGDPRGLLFLGTRFYHPPAFAGIPRVGRFGYDGQFYAALAIDPWLRSPETVKALDAPAYRATRILVPMAAWLVTLGRPQAAIVAYQGLCWALSILAVAVAAAWLRREGGSPWWALLLACNAGLVTAMLRTTLDGAAVFFVVAALWLARQRQHGGAVPMAAAGNLCREISCIVPLAQAVHEGTARRWKRALAYAVLPLLPVLAWQAYMRAVWHPNLRLPSSVGTPAMALVGKVMTVLGGRGLMLSQESSSQRGGVGAIRRVWCSSRSQRWRWCWRRARTPTRTVSPAT